MQAEAADPHWLVGRFAGARPAPGEEINKVQAVRRFRGRRPRRGPACLHHGNGVAPSLPHTRLSSGLHGAAPRPPSTPWPALWSIYPAALHGVQTETVAVASAHLSLCSASTILFALEQEQHV